MIYLSVVKTDLMENHDLLKTFFRNIFDLDTISACTSKNFAPKSFLKDLSNETNRVLLCYKWTLLTGPIMSKSDFLLYFGRSLYHHFGTKLIEIHKLMKSFGKIFQMRPTAFY